MLKLVRNILGDWRILKNQNNSLINWNLFIYIVNLQVNGGLHLATKLRRRHVMYHKENMKVSLAAQTFSLSVADALTFCEGEKYPGFENSGPTIEFFKYMNNIFDFLNTRNFLGKVKHKRPIYIEQENEINEFINLLIQEGKLDFED